MATQNLPSLRLYEAEKLAGGLRAPTPPQACPLSRELALLNLVGVVQHAIANLNLNDHPAALRTLLRGLEVYTLAESHTSKKENQSDGNRTAAA